MISRGCFLNFVNSLSKENIENLNRFLEHSSIDLLEKYDKDMFYKLVELFFTTRFDLEDEYIEFDDYVIDLFEELQQFGFSIKASYEIQNVYDFFESIISKYEYCLDKFYNDGQLRHQFLRKKNHLPMFPKLNINFKLNEALNEFREDDDNYKEQIEQQADRNSFNEIVGDAFDGDISAFWESTI